MTYALLYFFYLIILDIVYYIVEDDLPIIEYYDEEDGPNGNFKLDLIADENEVYLRGVNYFIVDDVWLKPDEY